MPLSKNVIGSKSAAVRGGAPEKKKGKRMMTTIVVAIALISSHGFLFQLGLMKSWTNEQIIHSTKAERSPSVMGPSAPMSTSTKAKTTLLPDGDALLTIAVDNYVSCPDKCVFAHTLLPPWVRYRYIDFADEKALADKLAEDNFSHLLIVARTNIRNLSELARSRRKDLGVSIGLWHMADERMNKGEIERPWYPSFDYVIRNYYPALPFYSMPSITGPFHNMTLRALGNETCGSSPGKLPVSDPDYEPRWGMHWAFLDAHELVSLLQRPGSGTTWPIKYRPYNCSFIGRKDVKRSLKQRDAMKTAMEKIAPDLNCKIEFTTGFAQGKTKFEYINDEIGATKIGLSPRGSAVETHRLPELLRMGTVPALVDEPYLHATFQVVPAVLGSDWTVVAQEMIRLIKQEKEGGSELEMLSRKGAKFYEDLFECMRSDLDLILRGAFFDRPQQSSIK